MFALLFFVALSTTTVDDFCRTQYGHPGDLGVTNGAEQYFKAGATYREIAATIGALGDEVASNDPNVQVYRWSDGQLEAHFRNGRLSMYYMNGRWTILRSPASVQVIQQTPIQNHYNEADRRQIYEHFYNRMAKAVQDGRQVASGQRERTDIRAMQYYVMKLRRAIDRGDWNEAQAIREKLALSPSSERGQGVAADAKRRLAERQRADEERRHREEMRQRAQIHQAEMARQQQIINEIRSQQNNR
jgi:hypothetical protein